MFKVIQIYLFLCLLKTEANAQPYQTYSFTENNGLSSYNVHKICQDKFGFIWIATQDGLNKFDGQDFQCYNKSSTPHLSGNDIRDVSYDSLNDIIWVSSSNGGIDGIKPGNNEVTYRLTTEKIAQYLPDPSVQQVVVLNHNEIALNTPSGIIIYNYIADKILKGIYQPFSGQNATNKFINGLFHYKNCLIAVTMNYGITIYNVTGYKLKSEQLFENSLRKELIYKCTVDDTKGKIYLPSETGVYQYSIETGTVTKIYNSENPVFCVKNISDTAILFATNKGVFSCGVNFENIKPISFVNDISAPGWQTEVNTIFQDKEKRIWYGVRKGVVIQSKTTTAFEKFGFDITTGEKLNHLYFIKFFDKENVLACDLVSLYKINLTDGSIKTIEKKGIYYYLFEVIDLPHPKFTATDKGLFTVKDFDVPIFTPAGVLYKELLPIQKYIFNSHIQLNDSLIVLSTEGDKGVFIWNIKAKKVISVNATVNIASNYTNGIARISDTSFLIATDSEAGIYYINSGKFIAIKITNELHDKIRLFMDVAFINNKYWVAGYGDGIFIYDTALNLVKRINTRNGLSSDGVYKFVKDDQNNVWVTTNYGLNRINYNNYKISSYFTKNGLHNNAFEEFSANILNGIVIAGGPNGFTKIDPAKIKRPDRPNSILFDYLNLTSKDSVFKLNLLTKIRVSISPVTNKVDIHIAKLNFDLATQFKYYYTIKELNNSWFELSANNFITLIGLSPGTYHLQVKAANEDGVWSEPKELILIFLPKWYQTWWFYLLIALTIAGILYALYRYRINQIKKQHAIRKNIATDLHDDLGSTLNSVKVFTNLAISGVKQEESLQQVKDNLTEATMSLRDMIWVLDDSLDTVDELITRLKQFAIPVAAASSIEAIIKADSDVNSRQLTKEEKRNLFLICKEAINNSIKYSCASQIDVSITASGKKIQIVIADNGKGFNVDEVKKGYGLKNMQYRARQINYNISLVSSLGKGTKFQINPGR